MNIGIILLAGSSNRYKGAKPKQFEVIDSKPLFDYAVSSFLDCEEINKVVLVVKADYLDFVKDYYKNTPKISACISGGSTRQESVKNALKFLKDSNVDDKILIHDAARPLVNRNMILSVIEALNTCKSCTIATKTNNTLCQSRDEYISNYVDRNITYGIETPQGFIFEDLYKAHNNVESNLFTDDSQLLKSMGIPTKLIINDEFNFKITNNKDMELFKIIIRSKNL